MKIEHKFYVGFRDINSMQELKNTSLLSYLEDVASMHSEYAGYGVTAMNETKKTWVLLSWKVHVIKRPKFNEFLRVQTWSRGADRYYALRDFYVYNQNDELVCIASSKWLFIDIEKGRPIKISDDVNDTYKPENIMVFDEENPKLVEPQKFTNSIEMTIPQNLIDVNNHLHNIYYMNIAQEALPKDIAFSNESNDFEIMYKKEIKYGEKIKALYSKVDNSHVVAIKNIDESVLHAIVKLS